MFAYLLLLRLQAYFSNIDLLLCGLRTCTCLRLIGVNLLIGTESGLMLLDRSGQGKGNVVLNR